MLNIVMELGEGGNLHDALEKQNGVHLSENAVWRYLLQICIGLQHIHSKKIVHRDLKALNIFLQNEDFVKIGARQPRASRGAGGARGARQGR